jgi:hypothetical protein
MDIVPGNAMMNTKKARMQQPMCGKGRLEQTCFTPLPKTHRPQVLTRQKFQIIFKVVIVLRQLLQYQIDLDLILLL